MPAQEPQPQQGASEPGQQPHELKISLQQVREEKERLKQAQDGPLKGSKTPQKLFGAVSMYSVGIDFTLIIAMPLVIFILLGQWLDSRSGTKHYVLFGILLAVIFSSVGIYRYVKQLAKKINR